MLCNWSSFKSQVSQPPIIIAESIAPFQPFSISLFPFSLSLLYLRSYTLFTSLSIFFIHLWPKLQVDSPLIQIPSLQITTIFSVSLSSSFTTHSPPQWTLRSTTGLPRRPLSTSPSTLPAPLIITMTIMIIIAARELSWVKWTSLLTKMMAALMPWLPTAPMTGKTHPRPPTWILM